MTQQPTLGWDVRRRTLIGGVALSWITPGAWATDTVVDADRFFRDEETLSAHLSPDGNRVALRTVAKHRGVMLSVLDLETLGAKVLHSQEGADACQVSWANANRLLFSIEERRLPQGRVDAGPGLFAINADGAAFRQLVERQEIGKVEKIDGGGISGAVPTGAAPKGGGPAPAGQDGMGFKQIADAPAVKNIRELESDRLQIWDTYLLASMESTGSDGVLAYRPKGTDTGAIELLMLNVRTGRSKPLAVPGSVVKAYADAAGDLRVVLVREQDQLAIAWRDAATGAWRKLPGCSPEAEADWGIRHIEPSGTLYISARRGQDKLALWSYDVNAAQWSASALVQSPLFDVDAQVLVSRGKVVAYRFTIDAEVTQWLDTEMRAVQQQLDQLLPRTINRISVAKEGFGNKLLVEAFSDRQPCVFLLYDRETRKLSRLGSLRPDIAAKDMAGLDLQRFKARDGLEIPVWVSVPKDVASQTLPAVILLGDREQSRSGSWEWNALTQFLVARGYVVLKPELRGTPGLGLRHVQAGRGAGESRIADDVADTVQWALAKGIVHSSRVAVIGMGTGAMSGLAAMARNPSLLRCAAVWATAIPQQRGSVIQQAVFLAYGERDPSLDRDKVASFAKALQSQNPHSRSINYKDEGNTLRDLANQIDFHNRVAQFLDKNLGAT